MRLRDGDPCYTACLKSKENAIFKVAKTLNNQINLNMYVCLLKE